MDGDISRILNHPTLRNLVQLEDRGSRVDLSPAGILSWGTSVVTKSRFTHERRRCYVYECLFVCSSTGSPWVEVRHHEPDFFISISSVLEWKSVPLQLNPCVLIMLTLLWFVLISLLYVKSRRGVVLPVHCSASLGMGPSLLHRCALDPERSWDSGRLGSFSVPPRHPYLPGAPVRRAWEVKG